LSVKFFYLLFLLVKEKVTSGENPLEDYIITKSLTKHPQDYPDKKNLPHVQVAMRMISNDIRVQAGDVIPYIICKVSPCYYL